jgi:hypothetical protein
VIGVRDVSRGCRCPGSFASRGEFARPLLVTSAGVSGDEHGGGSMATSTRVHHVTSDGVIALLHNVTARRRCQHEAAGLGGALLSLMIEMPGASAERLSEIEDVLGGVRAMLDSLGLDVSGHLSVGG